MSETVNTTVFEIELYDPTRDSLEQITQLLHSAYAKLASKGFNYVAATQSTEVTQSRLNSGQGVIARKGGVIIGTITYYTGTRGTYEPEHYKKSSIGHFGQFAVLPALQKHSIGSKLVEFVESLALADGKSEIACDTAEGAIDLVTYYKSRGYRTIGYHQWEHATYRSVLLSKSLK